VYATCRTASVSRTLSEITAAAKADRDELDVAYDAMNRSLGLPTGPVDPREYLARFASKLDLPPEIEHDARRLATQLREQGRDAGRNPGGVAVGCLYTAATRAGHDLTQKEAAAVADVTPVTLRSTYYELEGNGDGDCIVSN